MGAGWIAHRLFLQEESFGNLETHVPGVLLEQRLSVVTWNELTKVLVS